MSKQWVPINWSDECPVCGGDIEVHTDCDGDNQAYDGDVAQCTGCGHKGYVSADDGRAWVNWDGE